MRTCFCAINQSQMRSVVYFTTCASSALADDLSAAGYAVSKAKEISEVMYLWNITKLML